MLPRIATKISIAILVCASQCTYSQNIDSLKTVLNRVPDPKQKALITFIIGDTYGSINKLDSSAFYLNKAIQLATQLHYDSIIMESEVSCSFNAQTLVKYQEQSDHLDKAISIARASGNNKSLITFLKYKSAALRQMGQYTLSLEPCQEALEIAIGQRAKKEEASIDLDISRVFIDMTRYDTSLALINHCIRIYDSLRDDKNLARSYGFIVQILGKQKKYPQALKYGLIEDSLYAKIGNAMAQNEGRVNLAIIYKNLGRYDSAISIYNELLRKDNRAIIRVFVYSNLALAVSSKGEYENGLKYMFMAVRINDDSLHDPTSDFKIHKDIANNYFKLNKLDSALYYAKASEETGKKGESYPDEYPQCMSLLADIYAAKGDIKNAMAYSKKYEVLQDSIFQDRQNKDIAEQETRLKLYDKNKELALLAKENELNKIKQQRQLIALILGGLIVVVVIVGYRRAIKKNELLARQKQIIDAQVVQLESAATMKSKFLANISHELRTPVTLLSGMLELMSKKKPALEPKEAERLNVAYNNSRKLQHMVEEILDLTKLENNVLQPVYETKEIAPLLKRIVYTFETLIDKEHLRLQFEDAGANDLYVSIDPAKFEKIINNLIYNAIKFNRKDGFIKVVVHSSADKKQLLIDISDSGIGIAQEDMPHIFDHFYQGSSTGLKADGAGIGLSLVKEFTVLMGGTVDVKSRKNEGTTFSLHLPLIAAPLSEALLPEEKAVVFLEAWENFTRRQTVLIVEDNAEMRYYLKEVLGEKVNIATAGNGKEGLLWLDNNLPDLVISDVMMPEMDGREFINILKTDERYKKIPVITLTALADTDNQLSFLRLGIDDYIVKPFNADELRIRVYNLLANQAERRIFKEQPAEPDDIQVDSKEAEEFRNKVKEYVLTRLKNPNVSVFDLANELTLSERQLYRLAKSLTGFSPAQLIKEVRLQKALELLLTGDIYKIEDVSKRVGFEKASYFSQQFFERFGKRPSEFI